MRQAVQSSMAWGLLTASAWTRRSSFYKKQPADLKVLSQALRGWDEHLVTSY